MTKLGGFLAALLFSATAFAAISEPDNATRVYRNILVNNGFENGKAAWTASSGAFALVTSGSNLGTGNRSGSWDASAASQTLTATAVTIPTGFYASTGLAQCRFKTAATDYKFQVYDGSNVIAESVIPATSQYQSFPLNFPFPSSGSLSIRLSSQSDAAIIYIDDCYLGLPFNLTNVSQAQLYGSISVASCSAPWSTTGTSFADFATKSGCVYTTGQNAASPSTNIPAIKFSNLPPGNYLFQVMANIRAQGTSGAGGAGHLQLYDGTNALDNADNLFYTNTSDSEFPGFVGSASYTTPQSNITFSIRGKYDFTGSTGAGITVTGLKILVYRFPLSTEIAVRPDTTPSFWAGYHDNTCSWARAGTAYGDPTADASCVLVERVNQNFGTVATYASAGSPLPGITFTPTQASSYFICAHPKFSGSTTPAAVNFRIGDGTTWFAEAQQFIDVANNIYQTALCGMYRATSVSPVTISIQAKESSGTLTIANSVSTNISAIEWQVLQLSSSTSAPLLVGSVTSNTTGLEHIERALVSNNGSTCSVSSQSGSWISSIARTALGNCTLTLASSNFSAGPMCTCSVQAGSPSSMLSCSLKATPSTTTIDVFTSNSTTVNADLSFHIMCMGQR